METERYDHMREAVFARASQISDDEEELEALLNEIVGQAAKDLGAEFGSPEEFDLDDDPDRADVLLASIEAWASLASYATYEAYAGPIREVGAMHLRLAGWGKGIAANLTRLTKLLGGYLAKVLKPLNAISYSIDMGFPGGVSVGLSWS
jgi:hypothetical protein